MLLCPESHQFTVLRTNGRTPCANEHYSFVNISQNVMIVYVTLLANLENRDELSVVQFLCYIRQAFELKCI